MRLRAFLLPLIGLLGAFPSQAQTITTLIVEIHTLDERFAGTDDPMHLQIGGRDFPLDNPNRDDFERNRTDRFTVDLTSEPLSAESIRGVGQISVTKMEDSLFGGDWGFAGITIWAESTETEPLYQNTAINKWLDGDDLEWITLLGEPGWNVPEPAPFPPCSSSIILFAPAAGGDPAVDSDCDGIPDNADTSFDTPPDTDGDGLPDLYEDQTGSDPKLPDSDGDGWADGRNRRSVLMLTRIKCEDENEDIGSDELYLNSEDVRYPRSSDLEGNWPMNDGTVRSPGVIVDSRMLPKGAPAAFISRMRLRESDFTFLEKPFDDTFKTFEIEWDEDGTTTFTHDGDDARYVLTFRWFSMNVRDPTAGNADSDRDGLDEATEAKMSLQDPSVQPTAIAGHNGLADPEHRELWVEVDASGSDQRLMFDSKQMVASQLAYHGIAPRFDDGWFGNENNGQLAYVEVLRPTDLDNFYQDPSKFSKERRDLNGVFRYALLVDDLQDGAGGFGDATCNERGLNGCRYIMGGVLALGHTLTFQAQPIIFMHELGHTLKLCHRVGDLDPTNPPTCPASPFVRCADLCGIGQESNTAMGSETKLDAFGTIGGGTLTGVSAGARFGPVGAVVGGILGLIGGILSSDFYTREVDYHTEEWLKLRVNRS